MLLGWGSAEYGQRPYFDHLFWVYNYIVIFGKLSLGCNLIVQLCIFTCKDKAMLGYNVLVMYLRTIFFVSIKTICEKYHIRQSTFFFGGGGRVQ